MPPVLDPSHSHVDGLAFIGLSLCRRHPDDEEKDRAKKQKSIGIRGGGGGHPASLTHQTAWDLNRVLDRSYQYVFSTNDDGWLVGGGEPGPPFSYKLPAADSAHVEIMRIGTYVPEWGGLPAQAVVDAIQQGRILIPHMNVLPTAVVANPDTPPELEIRFDMEPSTLPASSVEEFQQLDSLPINWQLRFVHNQLFRYFQFPSRFCPGAFHSTIVRKAEFRSLEHRKAYFEYCDAAIQEWREAGPQPLVPSPPLHQYNPTNIATVRYDPQKADNSYQHVLDGNDNSESEQQHSGVWLFTDRTKITHWFPPNFHPPYDTPEKRAVIYEFLNVHWDEPTLSWKPAIAANVPKSPSRNSKSNKGDRKTSAKEDCGAEEEKKTDDMTIRTVPSVMSQVSVASNKSAVTTGSRRFAKAIVAATPPASSTATAGESLSPTAGSPSRIPPPSPSRGDGKSTAAASTATATSPSRSGPLQRSDSKRSVGSNSSRRSTSSRKVKNTKNKVAVEQLQQEQPEVLAASSGSLPVLESTTTGNFSTDEDMLMAHRKQMEERYEKEAAVMTTRTNSVDSSTTDTATTVHKKNTMTTTATETTTSTAPSQASKNVTNKDINNDSTTKTEGTAPSVGSTSETVGKDSNRAEVVAGGGGVATGIVAATGSSNVAAAVSSPTAATTAKSPPRQTAAEVEELRQQEALVKNLDKMDQIIDATKDQRRKGKREKEQEGQPASDKGNKNNGKMTIPVKEDRVAREESIEVTDAACGLFCW